VAAAAPLRVWLACDWFVKYTAGLASGLEEVGCAVTLLTRDHEQEFGGAAGAMGEFLAERLGLRTEHRVLAGRVSDVGRLGDVVRLRRAARSWRPDVVHVQDSLANDFRLALASGLPPRPYALTIHDPVPHPGDAVPPRSTRAARRLLRRGASLVFVHSEELRQELLEVGGTRAPVEVVPHGVAAAGFEPLPERPRLLFFGRISEYKGLDVLLEAMPIVWRSLPELTLTVAGEAHGPAPAHPVLADPRVEARIEHIPESAVAGLFAGSTCVVLPYLQASQSGVGSLSREHGRAVIASRVGGLPALVTPDWGTLVEPGDAAALAAAIVDLLGTEGRAEEMGRAAAAALGDSSWRRVAEATVDAYRRHLL
jgi:glycosyltransferase involved in cell wall biosynthesis